MFIIVGDNDVIFSVAGSRLKMVDDWANVLKRAVDFGYVKDDATNEKGRNQNCSFS